MWSDLAESGPGTARALTPPHECRCFPGRTTATLEATLNCPGTWYELDDGWWVHAWPLRRRSASKHRGTATEATTRDRT